MYQVYIQGRSIDRYMFLSLAEDQEHGSELFLLMNVLASLLEVPLVCVAVQSLIILNLGCALGFGLILTSSAGTCRKQGSYENSASNDVVRSGRFCSFVKFFPG